MLTIAASYPAKTDSETATPRGKLGFLDIEGSKRVGIVWLSRVQNKKQKPKKLLQGQKLYYAKLNPWK